MPRIAVRPVQAAPATVPTIRRDVPSKTVAALEAMLMESTVERVRLERRRRRWASAFFAATGVVVILSAIAWGSVTSTTNNYSGAFGEVNSYDGDLLTITSGGEMLQPLVVAAAGTTSGAAQEMALVLGAANTAIAIGDWAYVATVKEAAIAGVTSGTYKVELFQDGTSKGALYMKQATSDALSLEGVTFKWSLTSTLPGNAAYTIKVSSV